MSKLNGQTVLKICRTHGQQTHKKECKNPWPAQKGNKNYTENPTSPCQYGCHCKIKIPTKMRGESKAHLKLLIRL